MPAPNPDLALPPVTDGRLAHFVPREQENGKTPLHVVQQGTKDTIPIIQALLDAGADPSIQDGDNCSPADRFPEGPAEAILREAEYQITGVNADRMGETPATSGSPLGC